MRAFEFVNQQDTIKLLKVIVDKTLATITGEDNTRPATAPVTPAPATAAKPTAKKPALNKTAFKAKPKAKAKAKPKRAQPIKPKKQSNASNTPVAQEKDKAATAEPNVYLDTVKRAKSAQVQQPKKPISPAQL
jgi:hypothetical protein